MKKILIFLWLSLLGVTLWLPIITLSQVYGEFYTDLYCKGLWLLNETSGTNCADSSGANHPGTASGATIVTGYNLNGRQFRTGQSNDVITVADHADFTLTNTAKYTWEFLLIPLQLTGAGDDVLWTQYVSGFSAYLMFTIGDDSTISLVDGILVMWYNNASNYLYAWTANSVLNTTTWAYIAITYDGSLSQANRFTLYVNGRNVAGSIQSTGSISTIDPNSITIGNAGSGYQCFATIDMIRYRINYLASAEEIRQTWNLIKGAYGIQE